MWVAVVTGTLVSVGSVWLRCSAAESAAARACFGVVGSAVSASVTVALRDTAFLVAGSLWLCGLLSSTPVGWRCVPSGR